MTSKAWKCPLFFVKLLKKILYLPDFIHDMKKTGTEMQKRFPINHAKKCFIILKDFVWQLCNIAVLHILKIENINKRKLMFMVNIRNCEGFFLILINVLVKHRFCFTFWFQGLSKYHMKIPNLRRRHYILRYYIY